MSPRLLIFCATFRACRIKPKLGSFVSAFLKINNQRLQFDCAEGGLLITCVGQESISPAPELPVIDVSQLKPVCDGRSIRLFEKLKKVQSDLTEDGGRQPLTNHGPTPKCEERL